ncbi:chloride channel protein [Acidicapsa acidisoli]|uniref:chloride channel protein n=1 Tax=Acidicapsa acidisoli TaxID=1615681 RepID=UPI0021DFAC1D|nr:chloride channel protein [Acidicapsa acidisoli]
MPSSSDGSQAPGLPDFQRPSLEEQIVERPVFKQPASREKRLFLVLPIFIGILSGLLVVCFRISIEWLRLALMGKSLHRGDWRLIAVPAAIGLIVALLVEFVFPSVRGSGLNQTKAAMYIHDGYISLRTMFGKFICTALALGGGYSLGPEDPSLQIGAAISSTVSRRFGLSPENLRLFAPVGAAAGLAAAFNAPITALLFVIEEVVGNWNASVLGSIVLAAISGDAVSRWYFGDAPLFRIPELELRDPRELLAYAILGVAGGLAALVFAATLRQLRPRLAALPHWTRLVQPPLAGMLIGLIGFLGYPQVMGVGYETINQAIGGGLPWKLLLALAALKMLATTLGFSSGTPGGMFAPTLFIGAMLGTAIGSIQQIWLPHLTGPIGSYTLAGMGVLFAAFLRAPLTSVFMVLEVSGNYSIVAPVILANTVAYLIARRFDPVPIFEVFTRQDGLDLPSMEEVRAEERLHIEDALDTVIEFSEEPMPIPVLPASLRLREALNESEASPHDSGAVVIQFPDGNGYSLGAAELEKFGANASPETAVGDLLPEERLPLLYPDMPLDGTLRHFARWPALLIRNRARTTAVEGVLTENAVLACFREQRHGEMG